MDSHILARIRRWADPRLAALVLAVVPAACLGDLSEPDSVGATVEVTGTGAAALSVGSIQWLDGTYGAGCLQRSGSWSVRVSGSATMDYPALTVLQGNTACTLTLTKVVADTTYAGSPSIAMTTSYAGSASSFTASATLTPTKDSYVCGGANAGNNYGANSTVDLKWHTVSFDRDGWFSFNTSSYSSITSAILSLYLAGVGTGEVSPQDQVVKAYYAPSASDSWVEGTGTTSVPTTTGLTWTNAPSPGDTPTAGTSIASTTVPVAATAGTTFTWDVSSGVKTDNDGTATIVLSSWEGGDTNHAIQFGSRESANPPTLALDYGLFYGNAYLSSASFSSNFVVNLLVSDVPNSGTGALTAAECPTPSTVWQTGFESGAVSAAGASNTPASSLFNTVSGGGVTADQTVTRSGNVALEVAKTSSTSEYVQKTNLGSSPTVMVMRLGVRFQTLPTSNVLELAKIGVTSGANALLGFNATTSQLTLGYAGAFNTSDVYQIQNATSGLCLDDESNLAPPSKSPIIQEPCSPETTNNEWMFTSVSAGVYQIANQVNGYTLNQQGSMSSGGLLVDYYNPGSTSTNLRWTISGLSSDYSEIVSQTSSMCADDPSGSSSNGTQMDQVACSSGTTNDQWSFWDLSSTSPTISAGQWYRIDLRVNVSANPNTVDWALNGSAQTQATMAQAATTLTGAINLGSTVSADRYTAWYDDVIVSTSSGDYPFKDGHGLSLVPASYVGKTDPNGYLQTDQNVAVASASYSNLQKFPMTSTAAPYVWQATGSSTSYFADYGFSGVTNTNCVNGVSAVAALNANANGSNTCSTEMCYSGSCTAIHSDSTGTTAIQYRSLAFANPAGGVWSATSLSGLTAQIGYLHTASTAKPIWDALLVEYDQAARATSYATTVEADSPIAYWRLGDTSGTTAAAAVGSITGTYTGSPVLGMGGLVDDGDTSVRFPSGSSVDFGNSSTFTFSGKAAFSVECWINPPAASSKYPGIVTKLDSSSGTGWGLQIDSSPGGVAFTRNVTDYADSANSSFYLNAGTWYHVVGTYDGTNMKIYVNGVQEDSQTSSSSISANTDHLLVAAGVNNQLDPFIGTVDELAIYSVALTPTQVTNHYNAGKP